MSCGRILNARERWFRRVDVDVDEGGQTRKTDNRQTALRNLRQRLELQNWRGPSFTRLRIDRLRGEWTPTRHP